MYYKQKGIRTLYYEQNLTIAQISKTLKLARNTVYKYVNIEYFNIKPRKQISSKIEEYRKIIDSWLELDAKMPRKQRHTYKRIYDRLVEEHPSFNLSYSSVQSYARKAKIKLIKPYNRYLPLLHNPGEAQVDFFECVFFENNSLINGYAVILTFPYSNAAFCQLFRRKASECLTTGLKKMFEHIGGVPYLIWFDNDTNIIRIRKDKEKEINEHFIYFKNHYGIKAKFCNIHCANEKGNVEVNVKTLRNNLFVPIPQFSNIDEYNKELLIKCSNLLFREHYLKNENIDKLFEVDKKMLLTLPKIEFESETQKTRKVSKTGKITIDYLHHYYISPIYSRQKIMIKQTHKEIIAYDKLRNTEIVRLPRLFGSSIQTQIDWSQYLSVIACKTNSINNIAFTELLSPKIKDYLISLEKKT